MILVRLCFIASIHSHPLFPVRIQNLRKKRNQIKIVLFIMIKYFRFIESWSYFHWFRTIRKTNESRDPDPEIKALKNKTDKPRCEFLKKARKKAFKIAEKRIHLDRNIEWTWNQLNPRQNHPWSLWKGRKGRRERRKGQKGEIRRKRGNWRWWLWYLDS